MATVEQVLINFQGKDSVSPGIGSINKSISSLEQQAKKAGLTLQQIGEARGFNNLHSNISQSTSRMGLLQSAASKVRSTLESFSNVAGLLGSVVSLYAINNLTQSAIESSKSWNRIWANTNLLGQENVGIQKQIKSQVYDTAQKWGVATSELKAGVDVIAAKYGDINKAMEYSNGLAATSLLMNTSAEEVATALFRAEEGNLRTLKNKVLTIDQYNRYAADGVLTQEEINSILKENELRAQGLTETEAAKMQRMNNAVDKLKITLGSMLAGPLTSIAGIVESVANWFNSLDDTSKSVLGTVGLIGVGFVALAPFLAPAWDIAKGMAGSFKTVLERIGLINSIPCNPKECLINTKTNCVGGTGTGGSVAGSGAGAAGAGSLSTMGFIGAVGGVGALIAGTVAMNELLTEPARQQTGQAASAMPTRPFSEGSLKGTPFGGAGGGGFGSVTDLQTWNKGTEGVNKFEQALNKIDVPPGMRQILSFIGKIVCGLLGCSPGIVPALQTVQGVMNSVWGVFSTAWGMISNAVSTAGSTVMGVLNSLGSAFWGLVNTVTSTIGSIVSTVLSGFDQIKAAATGVICKVIGCSPGIIPSFELMADKVPYHIGRVMPHINTFNNALNTPKYNNLGSSGITTKGANVMYVTVDARNMNPGELQQKMIELNEQVS